MLLSRFVPPYPLGAPFFLRILTMGIIVGACSLSAQAQENWEKLPSTKLGPEIN
jgi:hypothetical protein